MKKDNHRDFSSLFQNIWTHVHSQNAGCISILYIFIIQTIMIFKNNKFVKFNSHFAYLF